MRTLLHLSLFSFLIVFTACKTESSVTQAYIGFYNVENLFDTLDTPDKNDSEFLPDGKNEWNSKKYFEKIQHINQVIQSMDEPLIMGFCEIENKTVVEDIVKYGSLKGRYDVVHFESNDQRGIDNALIYDSSHLSLTASGFLRFDIPDGGRPTRDIIWAKLTFKKDTFLIMVNHWPSRSGGQEQSEPKRIAAAQSAKAFIDSVLIASPEIHLVLMGDLNDYPENKAPSLIAESLRPMIFSTSGEYGGTHSYRGEWGVLDHIMINTSSLKPGNIQFIEGSGLIISEDYMKSTYKGDTVPFRTYGGGNYLGGYSDHFPVRVEINLKN